MDIWLPGISGIEALAQLRTEPATRDIPVIAVTASRSRQLKVCITRYRCIECFG